MWVATLLPKQLKCHCIDPPRLLWLKPLLKLLWPSDNHCSRLLNHRLCFSIPKYDALTQILRYNTKLWALSSLPYVPEGWKSSNVSVRLSVWEPSSHDCRAALSSPANRTVSHTIGAFIVLGFLWSSEDAGEPSWCGRSLQKTCSE